MLSSNSLKYISELNFVKEILKNITDFMKLIKNNKIKLLECIM